MKRILPKHHEKAAAEFACVIDSMEQAKILVKMGYFKKAQSRIEDISRSLTTLQDMQVMYEQAYTIDLGGISKDE